MEYRKSIIGDVLDGYPDHDRIITSGITPPLSAIRTATASKR